MKSRGHTATHGVPLLERGHSATPKRRRREGVTATLVWAAASMLGQTTTVTGLNQQPLCSGHPYKGPRRLTFGRTYHGRVGSTLDSSARLKRVPSFRPVMVSPSLDSEMSSLDDESSETMRETDDSTDESSNVLQLLSYLPDQGRTLPPRIQQLVVQLTQHYMQGGGEATLSVPSPQLPTLEELADLVEVEHRSRDVPVRIGSFLLVDVTATGDALDEMGAKLLSLGALYRLPQEITLLLLSTPLSTPLSFASSLTSPDGATTSVPSVRNRWHQIRDAFGAVGWKGVEFPMGLALRPQTKFRLSRIRTTASGGRRARLSWWHCTATLRTEAAAAVTAASVTPAPPVDGRRTTARRTGASPRTFDTPPRPTTRLNPHEFLQRMDAQFMLLQRRPSASLVPTTDATVTVPFSVPNATRDEIPTRNESLTELPPFSTMRLKLFFPHNQPVGRRVGWFRSVKRWSSRQYTTLKSQGRAGFIAYCFFNCVFYTMGIVWQWPRMASPDPLTSSLSVSTLVARKFGTVFAYLYALSQLLKLPKLGTAVGLAPLASRSLQQLQDKFHVSETVATVWLVAAMVMVWLTLSAIPIVSEYATLSRIVHLDDQLMQVYGLQPV